MVRMRGSRTAGAFCLAAAGLVAGCVHVPPVPVELETRIARHAAATLDRQEIDATISQIAPGASATGAGLDRLGLLAALVRLDPKLAEARKAIATARTQARASRQAAGPTLTLTSEYANDPATRSPWLLGGAVDLPLDVGGQRSARIERGELAVLMARQDFAETLWSERMALRRALVEHMIQTRRARLAASILALRDRQIAALERRARLGEAAALDLYPYRALRAQEARALADAAAQAAVARARIAGLIGLPEQALAGVDLLWPEFDSPAADPATSLDAAARQQAVAARADVLRAVTAYDQAESDVRAELARQYPTISLAPGYTWERGLVKLPLSVNLALPSFDLNRAAISAAVARRDQAGAAIEAVLADAAGAIDAALAEHGAAWSALQRIRDQEIPQTATAAARADDQLRLGAIGRAEWAAAQIAALEAQSAALDTLGRVQLAQAGLEEALRRPLDGPELALRPEQLETLP